MFVFAFSLSAEHSHSRCHSHNYGHESDSDYIHSHGHWAQLYPADSVGPSITTIAVDQWGHWTAAGTGTGAGIGTGTGLGLGHGTVRSALGVGLAAVAVDVVVAVAVAVAVAQAAVVAMITFGKRKWKRVLKMPKEANRSSNADVDAIAGCIAPCPLTDQQQHQQQQQLLLSLHSRPFIWPGKHLHWPFSVNIDRFPCKFNTQTFGRP